MKRFTSGALATTLALLFLNGQAKADIVTFNYSWIATPDTVLPSGTGSVTLALYKPDSLALQTGVLTVLQAASVTTTSAATVTPDTFNSPYSLVLTLKDQASSQSANLTFTGTITGSLTSTSSTLVNTFNGQLTQTASLGSYLYSATIDPTVANIPAPGSPATLLLDALVQVTKNPTTTPPHSSTPEPTSLVLGLTAAGLVYLSRQRRGRPSAPAPV